MKNPKAYFLPLILTAFLCSCSQKQTLLDQALKEAGPNRKELENVISHYKKQGDREKLKAAYFLIENMPGKYGVYYPRNAFFFDLISEIDSFNAHSPCIENQDNFVSSYLDTINLASKLQLKKIYDIKIISSDYLIENIDLAFKVWREKPWCKHLNFDEFCEWVLPYRVYDEPLQTWRKEILNELEQLEGPLENPSDPKEICLDISNYISSKLTFSSKLEFIPMQGGKDSWSTKTGTCEQCYLVVMLGMRSMGVPVSIDFTNKFAVWDGNHSWTVLLDRDKTIKPFNGGNNRVKFFDPPNCPTWYEGVALVTSVFRNTYARQFHPEDLEQSGIPEIIKNDFAIEVSHQYDQSRRGDIEVEIDNPINKYVMLIGFGKSTELIPLSYAKVNRQKAVFEDVQYEGIYIVGFNTEDGVKFDKQPFRWLKGKNLVYLTPNHSVADSITLYRKFPVQAPVNNFIDWIVSSKIQGSNYEDFKDAQTLYTIEEKDVGKEIIVNSNSNYKYYRYLPDSLSKLRIAEIQLFRNTKEGKELIQGIPFGSKPVFPNCDDHILENAFDGDISTNLNTQEGHWVALELKNKEKLASFRVIPRNHLNIIETGDTYELLYFDKEWKLHQRKKADDYSISFEGIPSNSLLLLRNRSKGTQEKIFRVVEGLQKW